MKRSEFKQRDRKCKICRDLFMPRTITHKACSPECAKELAISDRLSAERKDKAKRKLALKSVTSHANDAQSVVNKYIKWRDWGLECVSCGVPHKFDVERHASHLKSRGSSSFLRFNLWNIHMSCVQCNFKKAGNIAQYYPRLVERIGRDKVDYLDNAPKSRQYSIAYLLRIKDIFRRKAKRAEKRKNTGNC